MMLAFSTELTYGAPSTAAAPVMTVNQHPTTLDAFVRQVGRRAQIMAELAIRDREAALDIVQDSLLALVSRYAQRPSQEWAPLFYTILQSRLMDWKRREARRGKWMTWLKPRHNDDGDEIDPWHELPTQEDCDPAVLLERAKDIELVHQALADLPARQQQAFLLRAWEGMDTATTASVMGCSEGSVKTHYARALASLRQVLAGETEGHPL